MKKTSLVLILVLLPICARTFDISSIAIKLNAKYSVPVEYTEYVLSKAKIVPSVKQFASRVANAPEKILPFDKFVQFFVNEKRIQDGIRFFKTHRNILTDVSKRFGVDPYIIVAILSIETNLGKEKLKYNCLNSLYSLAQYSRRKGYFLFELESFIVYTYRHKLNPFSVKGSITCALGIPQFMPSNIDSYGVDFNGNGLNLNEVPDAIASVANFLKKHGWEKGKPIVKPCKKKDINGKRLIIKYSDGKKACYEVYKNFTVLKKYNGTTNYALAAYLLAKNIYESIKHH